RNIEQEHIISLRRRDLLKRDCAVENINAPSVCCDNQVVVARMHGYVSNGNRGDVVSDRHPVTAAVPGREDAKLRSTVEQRFYFRVFPDDVNITLCWKISLDRTPSLAVIR